MEAEQLDSALHWYEFERDGTHLACADFGGRGNTVVLLHGLAGHATEWRETASWLTEQHHVIALEARGHGRSERRPHDLTRSAHVADVETWIERYGDGPVNLIGQSLGGHTAFLVAARRPDLVAKLVVAEAVPEAAPGVPERIRESLEKWPVPFLSRNSAITFFGRNSIWAEAWADGLEQKSDGLWPTFDIDVMVEAVQETATTSYWEEWRRISCPTLVVVAQENEGLDEIKRMPHEQPHASLIAIPDAGHDLHLDNPQAWRHALEPFIGRGDSPT